MSTGLEEYLDVETLNFSDIMCTAGGDDSTREWMYCHGENQADYRLIRHCGEISFYCAACLDVKRQVTTLFCLACGHRETKPNQMKIYRRIDPL